MPIEVELPNGAIAEFPDGTSHDVIKGALSKHMQTSAEMPQGAGRFSAKPNPGLQLPEVDPLADTVKSGAAGLARGAIGMAGLPGTVEMLGRAGVNYAGRLAGKDGNVVSPETVLPTGSDLQKRAEGYTGKFYEPKTMVGRYAGAVGEFAPGMLFPGSMAQRVLGNVVGPAVVSETAGEMTKGTAYEPWARVAGAVAGGYAPNAVGRALTPAPSNGVRQQAVQTLQNEGVRDLTAGQITGANPLRYIEGAILDTPGTGARLPNMLERQAEQYTAAALRRAGVQGNRATQDVIDHAFTTQGQRFDQLQQASRAVLNANDAQAIGNAIRNYERLTPPSSQMPLVREIFDDIRNHAGNPIQGDIYQRYRSLIEGAARQATDPVASNALRQIRNVLDDAVERGLPPNLRGEWQQARTNYRNLLVVAKASGAAGEEAANGLISPARLAAAAKQVQGQRNFQRGQGDYAELARAGEAVMKQMPQSGTAPRLMAMQIGQTVAGGAAGAMAGGGDPTTAGLGAIAPWVIRGALGRGVMTPPVQRYLANQAVPGNAVSGRQGGVSAIAAALAAAQNRRPLEVDVYPNGDPRNRQ